jgi:UDPglucose 6-dehydrogenase
VKALIASNLEGRPVTVLGAAFKPNTDDVRESPALRVVQDLLDAGATVTVHDPVALENFGRAFDGTIRCEPDLDAALRGAEAVLVVTSWPEYRDLPARLGPDGPVVVDGRRMFPPEAFQRYEGIGR